MSKTLTGRFALKARDRRRRDGTIVFSPQTRKSLLARIQRQMAEERGDEVPEPEVPVHNDRTKARLAILEAANKYTQHSSYRVLTMKNINEAVAIVRHHGTVDASILEAAGFKAKKG